MLKNFLLAFLLCLSGLLFAQKETHVFTRKDTSFVGPSGGWNIRADFPTGNYTGNNPDTASRPAILFMVGVGEVGAGNFSGLALNGPHYWLNNGWGGGIKLGNGTHYPIIISISPYAAWPSTRSVNEVVDFILGHWHIKRNSLHITGLSMGAMTWGRYATSETSKGARDHGSKARSLLALQGEGTALGSPGYMLGGDNAVDSSSDYAGWGVWALRQGGRYFGLTGTNDFGKGFLWKPSENMNDSLAGSAYHSYEHIGGGTHCCWNNMYDTTATNWTAGTGTNLDSTAWDGTHYSSGTYTTGDFLFKWMLKQGDTSLVGSSNLSPTANAGLDASITLPTSTKTLTGSGSDADGTISSYTWTQIAGTTATIVSPSSATTNITGLSTAGTRTFRLTVTDNLGATGSDDVVITVNPLTCGTTLTLNGGGNWGSSNALITPACDTLFLSHLGGNADTLGLWIGNWVGTPDCYKVIMADRSLTRLELLGLQAQIYLFDCEYVKILGFGDGRTRGSSKIYINHANAGFPYGPGFHGISIGGRSKNIYVDGVEMYNVNQGIEGKQDPICDSNYVFIEGRSNNFVRDSMVFTHNIIVRTQAEGIYKGNTGPYSTPSWQWNTGLCADSLRRSAQERYVLCPAGKFPVQVPTHTGVGGLDTFWVEPIREGYTLIDSNYTDSTGRGGIQATNSDPFYLTIISNNLVKNAGMFGRFDQGTGISIGYPARGWVHHNTILKTLSEGFVSFGASVIFENNYVDSSGFLNPYNSPYFEGNPPLPGWDFSSQNPGSCCNSFTDHRPSIKFTSEIRKSQISDHGLNNRLDSIIVIARNNILGDNKSQLQTFNELGSPENFYISIWFQDYYQLFPLATPAILCNNVNKNGTLLPFTIGGISYGRVQRSTLGTSGSHCFRFPQEMTAYRLNDCEGIRGTKPKVFIFRRTF